MKTTAVENVTILTTKSCRKCVFPFVYKGEVYTGRGLRLGQGLCDSLYLPTYNFKTFSFSIIKMATKEEFMSGGIFGEVTKNLRGVWNTRVVDKESDVIKDELKIRQLFNDLRLYPSKSQVYEMIHCARKGDSRDFLTFGEFCIFATELEKQYDSNQPIATNINESDKTISDKVSNESNPGNKKSTGCSYDVFLGNYHY